MKNVLWTYLSFCVIVLVAIFSGSLSSVIISIITFVLGWVVSISLTKKNTFEREKILNVFFIVFNIFTIAMLLQWFAHLDPLGPFAIDRRSDSYAFWLKAERASYYSSIKGIYDDIIVRDLYHENEGFYFFITLLSFLANKFLDGNHLLMQMLVSPGMGLITSLFVYRMLLDFVDSQRALKYTLYYSFAILLPMSVLFLRDIHIACFYSIVLYLYFCKNFNLKILFLWIIIAQLTASFRFEHGLFLYGILLVTIFLSKNKWKYFYVFCVLLVLLFNIVEIFDFVYSEFETVNSRYVQKTEERVDVLSSGLGRFMFLLPSPIKEFVLVGFVHLQFPPWHGIVNGQILLEKIIGGVNFLTSYIWFKVFCLSSLGLLRVRYKNIPIKVLCGVGIYFLFLFANVSDLNFRRVICIYPLLYIFYVFYLEYCVLNKELIKYNKWYNLLFFGLSCAYLILSLLFA